jgi:hypothetical protein
MDPTRTDLPRNERSPDQWARLLATPFVSSWVGRARPGELRDADAARRASAWATWAVESLAEIATGERTYPALWLPGHFYDPKGTGPKIRPHLEIPARQMNHPDPEFPDRLAQVGNGLSFPYWLYSEVTAVRRALFNTAAGPVGELLELLCERRSALVAGLELLSSTAAPRFGEIASMIIAAPDGLAGDATGDFTAGDVARYFPAASELELSVTYDSRLREKNGTWASRRVGVWQLAGRTPGGDHFSLGVVTPRLTVNSLFHDRLFDPHGESSAALLVRALLMRRLVDTHLASSSAVAFQVGDPDPGTEQPGPTRGAHLRAVVARVGHKLPDASVGAAVNFLRTYPDPDAAWAALHRWADKGYLLTVTAEGFKAAHRDALRHLSRAEEPDREAIGLLLPLAWDVREGRSQVVRVSFSRPAEDDDAAES